ncbi:hypothetical protein OF001_U20008 [Pseudomonas sp. OF001]|nr:hypothetical protein OF001_U20008 [Pseudomonas sp. OF001]
MRLPLAIQRKENWFRAMNIFPSSLPPNPAVNRIAGNTHRSPQAPCPAAGYLAR